MNFCNNLKSCREKRNLHQYDIAAYLGVSNSYVTRLERGTREPSIGILNDLSKFFGVTIDELINGDSENKEG